MLFLLLFLFYFFDIKWKLLSCLRKIRVIRNFFNLLMKSYFRYQITCASLLSFIISLFFHYCRRIMAYLLALLINKSICYKFFHVLFFVLVISSASLCILLYQLKLLLDQLLLLFLMRFPIIYLLSIWFSKYSFIIF